MLGLDDLEVFETREAEEVTLGYLESLKTPPSDTR